MNTSLVGWVALVGLVTGCGASEDRPPPAKEDPRAEIPGRAPKKTAAFTPSRCFTNMVPGDYAAECGTVTVRAGGSGSDEIELAVMVLYSDDDAPADPVVYLEGGPGGSGILVAAYDPFPFETILEHRDLILVDQRGTGFSDPSLRCYGSATELDDQLAELDQCKTDWEAQGVDFAEYNTRRNARDMDQVRHALGYDTWNLYGISYGSRLALTIVRDYPEAVRSMVIDGVLPLQVDLLADGVQSMAGSLEALTEACNAQPDCADAYGDVAAKLFEAADQLEAEPAELEIGVELDGETAFAVVMQLLYSSDVLPYIPALVAGLLEGDYSLFELLLADGGLGGGFATGMYYAVTCQDEAAFTSPEIVDAARADFDPRYAFAFDAHVLLDVCDHWSLPAAPSTENEGVESDVPSLVTSGAFDPVTPPAYGALAAEGLSHAQQFVLADQAHGASVSKCGAKLVNDFFDEPSRKLASDCVDNLGPPNFVTGRQQALVTPPRLHFEVPVRWDAELIRRLAEAAERARRLAPRPPR